jgi:hypothetical protein
MAKMMRATTSEQELEIALAPVGGDLDCAIAVAPAASLEPLALDALASGSELAIPAVVVVIETAQRTVAPCVSGSGNARLQRGSRGGLSQREPAVTCHCRTSARTGQRLAL